MRKAFTLVLLIGILFPIISLAFLNHHDPSKELLSFPTDGLQLVNLPEQWFSNLVDHFDPTNLARYQQRYFSSNQFFDQNDEDAPVFLYVGCEGPITDRWAQQGLMYEWAKKLGAMMFVLEHRYYGYSQPADTWKTPDLKYLTTEQALADLAAFVTSFKHLRNRPWIAFGGSYGGSLVAWARYKYPSLIHGAVSASGVFDPKIDFPEYLEVANDALMYYGGKECVANFFNATREMSTRVNNINLSEDVYRRFKLCNRFTGKESRLEMMSFWAAISDTFAGVVQYNREDNPTKMTVKDVCDMLSVNNGETKYELLSKVYQRYLDENQQPCIDWTLQSMIDLLSDDEIVYGKIYRTWIYQTCTAYGFYQTSTTVHTFGDPFDLTFFEHLCTTAYGPQYTLDNLKIQAQKIIDTYSQYDFRSSNVIFTNGNIDPWHAVSILDENTSLSNYNHFIMGTSHCAPLYPELPYDNNALKDARKKMFQQILLILDDFKRTITPTR